MTLVEDVTGRDGRVVEPAESRLRHDEGMVGDDNAGLPCLANVLFDKTAPEMRTGRVHAFAAAVGEPVDAPAAYELGEPARKVSRDHISGVACGDPTGDQPQMRQRFPRPHQCGANRLLVIQQTEEVFAPLADDDTASFQLGIGVEAVEFGGNLSLQVAGIG